VGDLVVNLRRILEVILNLFCFVKSINVTFLSFISFAILLGIGFLIRHVFITVVDFLGLLLPTISHSIDLSFLDVNLLAELFDVRVGLIQNLHETLILLKVDEFKPVIKVIFTEQLLSFGVLLCLLLCDLFLAVLNVVLENDSLSLCLGLTLFVELMKIFGVLKDLAQEFLVAVLLACFLATAHVLLEPIKSAGFFLVGGIALGSPVEVSINKLSLV